MFLKLNENSLLNATELKRLSINHDAISDAYILSARTSNGAMQLFASKEITESQKALSDLLELIKETPINVTDKFNAIPVSPASISISKNYLYVGEKATVTVEFSRPIKSQGLLTVSIPDGLSGSTNLTISEDGRTGTTEVTAQSTGEKTISVSGNHIVKNISVVVGVKFTFDSATANQTTLEQGQKTTVTCTFSKAPDLSNMTFIASSGLVKVDEPRVSGNTIVTSYKCNKAGTETINCVYVGFPTKTITITVNEPKPTMTVNNVPGSLTVGQVQTLDIVLNNATDYEVSNDNTEAATFGKDTKILRAIANNSRPVNLIFTPTRGSVRGNPVTKSITINSPVEAMSSFASMGKL